MWPNPQFSADLLTFAEEILNGKFRFLCVQLPLFLGKMQWSTKKRQTKPSFLCHGVVVIIGFTKNAPSPPMKIFHKKDLMTIQEWHPEVKITVGGCLALLYILDGVPCYNSLWLKRKLSNVLARGSVLSVAGVLDLKLISYYHLLLCY